MTQTATGSISDSSDAGVGGARLETEAGRGASLAGRLHELDRRGYEYAARSHNLAFEAGLPALSRIASYSRLWIAVSLILALGFGKPGRRTALHALVAVVVTSVVANLLMKPVADRVRPDRANVPPDRHVEMPESSSFPSGHSASAFAFALTVASEQPLRIAAPVGLLAAAVAYSRVYTGVHYPGDVLAGSAVGASVAVALRVLWRRRATKI